MQTQSMAYNKAYKIAVIASWVAWAVFMSWLFVMEIRLMKTHVELHEQRRQLLQDIEEMRAARIAQQAGESK